MDFGRVEHIDEVNFSLPVNHPAAVKILGGERSNQLRVYVGAPIWSDLGFLGTLYPASAKEKDYLKYYAKQFNVIEFNATHYKIPAPATIIKWKKMVGSNFVFSPKVPQSISHAVRIDEAVQEMNYFIEVVSGFEENLGTAFLQLPPTFSAKGKDALMHFLDYINPIQLSVELRHPDWFAQGEELKELSNFLYKKRMGLVITDVAGRRDVAHMRLTNKTAMIRFGAHDLHPTDFERMDEWAARCGTWINQGLEQLYFFAHSAERKNTAALAAYFIKKINPYLQRKLASPILQGFKTQDQLF